eukprot:2108703-Ditylum_brightwellii.AAC.1
MPKGTVRAGPSVDSKLSIWSLNDSSLVYILDSIHSRKMEDYSRIIRRQVFVTLLASVQLH